MHWNLFTVLESDLSNVSRFIEFDERNFKAFSTELSKLLLSIGSEVDVVFKQLCKVVDGEARRKNIVDYYAVLSENDGIKSILAETVSIPRFGLEFNPFEEWDADTRPKWWKSYNKVKHDRQENYHEASLENVLRALSALMLCIFYLNKLLNPEATNKEVTSKLQPNSQLLRLKEEYYYSTVVV
ncbi:hypothetical protein HB762_17880 [Vibrio campbellii]|uniref:Uncharacterized protein n=1 Tax=Vibrio campbellii TaxID=680 RepID=A0ABY5IGD2_9VIBR|nr:hypothetical protein [Vibrio campbellii]UTZ33184.1 hypothetical protein HB762_17880 [Vibrio campbellii]